MMAFYNQPICFCFILIFFFIFPASLSIPFIFLHGFNSQCEGRNTELTQNLSTLSGAKGYCIEVGNGILDSWFKPVSQQANIICEQVKQMDELKEGFNLIGSSQGNMIGRAVIEFCEGAPPVSNYISMGGPHAGIAAAPYCGDADVCHQIMDLLKSGVYSDVVQEHFAPGGYIKVPNDITQYLEKSTFLPKLNNELLTDRNSTYKTRFSSLNNLVLIMFEEDEVLIPKETSWFGYYPNGAFGPVIPAQKTPLYEEDWIGLKTLDDAGKVHFVSVPGAHVRISMDDAKKYVVPYLQN